MKHRTLLIQIALALVVLLGLWGTGSIVTDRLHGLGVQVGFGFLLSPAGFDIGDTWLAFDASHNYAQAFAVGLFNTVRVALVAMVASVLFGGLLGLGQLSRNRLLAKLCEAYVEVFRNVPLLLQLLIVYVWLIGRLPLPADAWQLAPNVWLSKSGLAIPWFGAWWSGSLSDTLTEPSVWQVPTLGNFTFSGGLMLTPEFIAVAIGLTLYTSAYIAETVRGSVQAVAAGQRRAALALGLTEAQSLRYVVVPQALRSMIPPLANQLLNLIKNSSLAVAVGYPDLVAIADTTLNQTSHAVECVAIIMAVYLVLSLLTAALMGSWHRRLLKTQAGVA